jgi:hypothetical protein
VAGGVGVWQVCPGMKIWVSNTCKFIYLFLAQMKKNCIELNTSKFGFGAHEWKGPDSRGARVLTELRALGCRRYSGRGGQWPLLGDRCEL